MATKRTRWKPDTCECVLEYEWDDTTTNDTRVHTPVVAEPCAAHVGQTTVADRYATVMEENGRKNEAHGWIYENLTSAVEEVVTPRGTEYRLRDGRSIAWSFNEQRQLVLALFSFTSDERSQVQAAADARWPGKVLVVAG